MQDFKGATIIIIMFGSEQQQIFLTHQQYQQTLARFQHDQQQQPRMRVQQQYSSRVHQQYHGSNRYFQNESSSLQQQQQQTQQAGTPITNQNEHRSNNFNQQNSFQNHRGKQHHREFNRDRDSGNRERNNQHQHRKHHNNRNNQQQQHQNGSNSAINNNNNNNNNNMGERQNGKKASSNRLMQTKSDFGHDRKNLLGTRSNSNESQHKTSTSPTPPSSVKSLSPQKSLNKSSMTNKDELRLSITSTNSSSHPPATNYNNNTITVELTDDSISNSSGNSLGGLLIGAGDGVLKNLKNASYVDNSSKEHSINSWINANNQYTGIHNGLSASAEQLNMRGIEHYPTHFRKRPPSVNAIPRDYELSLPFDYYLARIYNCDNDTRSEPPNLKCNSQWDPVSMQIWERYCLFQQTQITFRNKIHVWRELFEFLKVTLFC